MAHKMTSLLLTSVWTIVALSTPMALACNHPPNRPRSVLGEQERLLSAAKGELMSADYRADLLALASLRERLIPLENDPAVGYLAHYWSGFASWRSALNGANHQMKGAELKLNVEQAAIEFDAAIRARDDFADAYAAAASVNGWLGTFYMSDPRAAREHWEKSSRLLARAKQLEPTNPRVLWVEGGDFFFKPVAYGGDPERGMEIYRQILALDQPASIGVSPLPDWGRVEALMALGYAYLNQAEPDLAAAEKEAREALRLQPDWSYVRDNLLPQIAARQSELGAASSTTERTSSSVQETPSVTIQRFPAQRVLYRTILGPYSLHPEAIKALCSVAGHAAAGDVIGIYPYDPSTVPESELEWSLAVPINEALALTRDQRDQGYSVRTLPGVEAAVVRTTVARAAQDGLQLFYWLPTHDWIQAGPTRMSFGASRADAPLQSPATIFVPVRRLQLGLAPIAQTRAH